MNDKFPDHARFELVGYRDGSALLEMTNDFRFHSSRGTITVPQGFITDGASIPRIFWNILSPYGEYFPAALIHDFLYSSRRTVITRATADAIFLEGMEVVGVPWLKRQTIYRAVRLFGGSSYRGVLPPF